MILESVRDRVAEDGITLDIGDLPEAGDVVQGSNDDPERLAKIVSRIVARVGDRVPVLKSINRHMEGENRRAGIVSDVFSALYVLYERNPKVAHDFIRTYAAHVRQIQRERKAHARAQAATQPYSQNHQQNGGPAK